MAVLLLTSKGAAGVTGSGFITLAATLSSTGHSPVVGLTLLLGVDRSMSEARALTNLVGNAVAALVVARWEDQLDLERARSMLSAIPARARRNDWRSDTRDARISAMSAALQRALTYCVLAPALVGCASATGLAWVDEPVTAASWTESERGSVEVSVPVRPSASSVTAAADAPTGGNHQRLSHTVTLGSLDQPGASAATPGPLANGASVTVTINNYTQSAPAYGGYSGYGGTSYARTSAGNSQVTNASPARGSSSLQPGQNWPAPADHGTSFPYRSAPASPWSRAQ